MSVNKRRRRNVNKRWDYSAFVKGHREKYPSSKAFRKRRGTKHGKHK